MKERKLTHSTHKLQSRWYVAANLVAVREEVAVAVAPNEFAELPLRVHGRHGAVIEPIILARAREVLVGVRDTIRIVVHAASLPACVPSRGKGEGVRRLRFEISNSEITRTHLFSRPPPRFSISWTAAAGKNFDNVSLQQHRDV